MPSPRRHPDRPAGFFFMGQMNLATSGGNSLKVSRSMAITEVTNQSWFTRLGKSVSGIFGGIILFVISIILLAWNEGRAVKTAKGLEEGSSAVASLESVDRINPEYNGRLIHLTGLADGKQTLSDPEFGLEVAALKLQRNVEMLQWKEKTESTTRNKLGGGTETVTTYTYEKVWSDTHIDSSGFKEPEGHQNPDVMPLQKLEKQAENITLGAYKLSPGLVSFLKKFEEVPPPETLPEGYLTVGPAILKSKNPSTPQIGDLRITFKAAMPAEVSIIARQNGSLLEGYTTRTGTVLQMLQYGKVSAAAMFASAKSANKTLTWGLRLLGFILLFLAAKSMLGPIAVLADVLPLAGKVVRLGTTFIAALVALPVGLLTIAIAWIAYRPVIGITLLVIGVAIPVLLFITRKKATSAIHA